MMKKAILGALAVPLLVVSTLASAQLVNYQSTQSLVGINDTRLFGSFTWDTVNETYSSVDLSVMADGITFTGFTLDYVVMPDPSTSTPGVTGMTAQSFSTPANINNSGGSLTLYDADVKTNISGAAATYNLGWSFMGQYDMDTNSGGTFQNNINIPSFGEPNSTTEFAVTAVPEPSIYAMMALGLFGVFAASRRKTLNLSNV